MPFEKRHARPSAEPTPSHAIAAYALAEQRALPERLRGIDQVLSTREVERITGRHRCTIWRWVQAGSFPEKRGGGGRGWLRSDVELWLRGDNWASITPTASGSGSRFRPTR